MTLYSYRCKDCGEQFDMRRKADDPAPCCPICGGQAVKQFVPVAVKFTGDGFYSTDNRKDE